MVACKPAGSSARRAIFGSETIDTSTSSGGIPYDTEYTIPDTARDAAWEIGLRAATNKKTGGGSKYLLSQATIELLAHLLLSKLGGRIEVGVSIRGTVVSTRVIGVNDPQHPLYTFLLCQTAVW